MGRHGQHKKGASMNRAMIKVLLAVLLLFAMGSAMASSQEQAKPKSPVFTYWDNWTDSKGVSHLSKCEISDFVFESISEPAEPSWLARQKPGTAQVVITVMPEGWKGPWHENPKVQWIIPLKGTWFVETMDGTRVNLGPGEVSVGEDLNTKPDAQGRKGHLSGTVGEGPVTLMIIQLDEPAAIDQPCRFK
jgi:hypothetical protein